MICFIGLKKRLNVENKTSNWHLSRYFIYAKLPKGNGFAALDLFQGSFVVLTTAEMYLLSIVETLDPAHPAMEKFQKYGLVVDFDQTAALDALGRAGCGHSTLVNLTICPTMGCNFDCPYCFEEHRPGKMSKKTQDEVIALADRMMTSFGAKNLRISWYGGEPLIAADVVESLSQRLMDLARSKNASYKACMVTNGYLLNADKVALLERCNVTSVQITLDGLGEEHDKTRRLAGGGGSFDRIVENLRDNKLPFHVTIRHNAHRDNLDQVEKLRAFVDRLAKESGNDLYYYTAFVHGNAVMERHGQGIGLLQAQDAPKEIQLRHMAERYTVRGGTYCSANRLYDMGIDDQGRLFKCWEEVDKPERSFGHVSTWNPDDPVLSAERKDLLTAYLNTCCPVPDPKCRECLWLPMCCGGCPYRRMIGEQTCFLFKDDPEAFALAVYQALREKGPRVPKEAEMMC